MSIMIKLILLMRIQGIWVGVDDDDTDDDDGNDADDADDNDDDDDDDMQLDMRGWHVEVTCVQQCKQEAEILVVRLQIQVEQQASF